MGRGGRSHGVVEAGQKAEHLFTGGGRSSRGQSEPPHCHLVGGVYFVLAIADCVAFQLT